MASWTTSARASHTLESARTSAAPSRSATSSRRPSSWAATPCAPMRSRTTSSSGPSPTTSENRSRLTVLQRSHCRHQRRVVLLGMESPHRQHHRHPFDTQRLADVLTSAPWARPGAEQQPGRAPPGRRPRTPAPPGRRTRRARASPPWPRRSRPRCISRPRNPCREDLVVPGDHERDAGPADACDRPAVPSAGTERHQPGPEAVCMNHIRSLDPPGQ